MATCFPLYAAQYTSAKNDARRETYDEAVALDERTWDAWHSTHAHAHTHISGVGDTSLEAKLDALVAEMQQQLGMATSGAAEPLAAVGGRVCAMLAESLQLGRHGSAIAVLIGVGEGWEKR